MRTVEEFKLRFDELCQMVECVSKKVDAIELMLLEMKTGEKFLTGSDGLIFPPFIGEDAFPVSSNAINLNEEGES